MDQHNLVGAAPQLQVPTVPFALPPLPYGVGELEPLLSEEALLVHHGKHHARYVETLNRLMAEQHIAPDSLEAILRAAHAASARALFNNAAQAWNHAIFWESMTPLASCPGRRLARAIARTFGSLEALRERFIAEGAGHFGSGWVWIVARGDELMMVSTHDAATPIVDEHVTPLLACDVWEHAYYIDYRQNRASWLATWWDKLANWKLADNQYGAALGEGAAWNFPAPGA